MQVLKRIFSRFTVPCSLCRTPLLFSCDASKIIADKANDENSKYYFGSGKVKKGYQQVLPTTIYTGEKGYNINI